MPAEGVCLMPHGDILTYEEIHTVTKVAAELGISKVRLTGGEPLVRLGLPNLVKMLASIDGIDDISLTTNGVLLSRYAAELKSAGLWRVNISLDSLRQDKFESITRGGDIRDVLDGIEVAKSVGLNPVKINVVAMAGKNDDELDDFAAKTIDEGWHVRFIEFMPVIGEATVASEFISVSEIRNRIEVLGVLEPCMPSVGNGPAKYFRFPNAAGSIGFITPVSEHFCISCNRLRLTADGKLRLCLLSSDEIDLKASLRNGISPAELKLLIEEAVTRKPMRHRLAEGQVPKDRPFSQVGG